ncbi:MAG: hypothetical protein PUP46_00955 [Endozoicomonas sp. (ex Botrylloides leachii)]|nr:hypothetical protein [Endozoicomonas sp. (ex Botrylloides leachii)]
MNLNKFIKIGTYSATCILITGLLSGCFASDEDPNKNAETSQTNILTNKPLLLDDIQSLLTKDTGIKAQIQDSITQQVITPLSEKSYIILQGPDAETRPVAVNFQKAVEQKLLEELERNQIVSITACIHTDKPATPLCNPANQALSSSMHSEMAQDPDRVKTIADRTVTVRKMAGHGEGLKLYVAYPQAGMSGRTDEEQSTYRKEVESDQNVSLVDTPLNLEKLPDGLSGATYVIDTGDTSKLVFSIAGQQATMGSGQTDWYIWFGELEDLEIKARCQTLQDTINNNSAKKIEIF